MTCDKTVGGRLRDCRCRNQPNGGDLSLVAGVKPKYGDSKMRELTFGEFNKVSGGRQVCSTTVIRDYSGCVTETVCR